MLHSEVNFYYTPKTVLRRRIFCMLNPGKVSEVDDIFSFLYIGHLASSVLEPGEILYL